MADKSFEVGEKKREGESERRENDKESDDERREGGVEGGHQVLAVVLVARVTHSQVRPAARLSGYRNVRGSCKCKVGDGWVKL